MEAAFELAASDEKRVEEAAMVLRRHIIESNRASGNIPFPPKSSWLLSEDREPPDLLQNFLSSLVLGKSCQNLSERSKRFVSSFPQDICYAATNGQWLMPKHVMLAMTVHHLTGSAELITILNRFGHCQSYSRTLELETATCKSILSSNTYLPPSISTESNKIVYFCWDNFDLNEETHLVLELLILRTR